VTHYTCFFSYRGVGNRGSGSYTYINLLRFQGKWHCRTPFCNSFFLGRKWRKGNPNLWYPLVIPLPTVSSWRENGKNLWNRWCLFLWSINCWEGRWPKQWYYRSMLLFPMRAWIILDWLMLLLHQIVMMLDRCPKVRAPNSRRHDSGAEYQTTLDGEHNFWQLYHLIWRI